MRRRYPYALLFAVFFLPGCGSDSSAPPTDQPILAAFDLLWQRYDETYPYFEFKRIDWNAARAQYRPRAESARSGSELADIVREMLAPLRDVHVALTDPAGRYVATYTPPAFVNIRNDVWTGYMGRWERRIRPNWGYAETDSVPYLYFSSWSSGGINIAAVDSALERYRDRAAMIIDVRMNGGGNDQLAFAVAGRFYDRTHAIGYVQYRNGSAHSAFTAPQSRIVEPRGSWQFRKPVLLLTGRGSFSSTENFVMAMRLLPNVTVVGDTTGGGSGNPATHDLIYGWKYTLPRWIERTPDHQVVEWNGLAPNVVVAATPADFNAGVDPVLEFAARWAGNQVRSSLKTLNSR